MKREKQGRRVGKATTSAPRKVTARKGTLARSQAVAAAGKIYGWEDDPGSSATPIERPIPGARTRLAINVSTSGKPARAPSLYQSGTTEFRHWVAVEALDRAVGFWTSLVPAATAWQSGKALPAILEAGQDLNAYYDRRTLSFFWDRFGAGRVFSGESPDVLAHELGHAVLDALRPQLWAVADHEPVAFHEAFGDMSAVLTALQLPSLCRAVIDETDGQLARSSRLSRIAEQLGAAIRARSPASVDANALRELANSFFYCDPSMLPPLAPSSTLSSEPHSFARVFGGAFLDALAGMYRVRPDVDEDVERLAAVAGDMGRLTVAAVRNAAIVTAYYSEVASAYLRADAEIFNGLYREPLAAAFVRFGILSLESVRRVAEAVKRAPRGLVELGEGPVPHDLAELTLSGTDLGLDDLTIVVEVPAGKPQLAVRSATGALGGLEPPSAADAASSFVRGLLLRGQIEVPRRGVGLIVPSGPQTTHALEPANGKVRLVRRRFACGPGRR